jgi:hypothetical protein
MGMKTGGATSWRFLGETNLDCFVTMTEIETPI